MDKETNVVSALMSSQLLKGKLRHIKIFKNLSKNGLESGDTKPEVLRSVLRIGARGKTYIEKV